MPCASGQVNDTAVSVLRDTGSTVCMVGASLGETRTNDQVLWLVCAGRWDDETLSHSSGWTWHTVLLRHSQCIMHGDTNTNVIIGNIPGALGAEPRCQINRVNMTVKYGVNDILSRKWRIRKITQSHLKLTMNRMMTQTDRQSWQLKLTETCAAVQTRSVHNWGKQNYPKSRNLWNQKTWKFNR